MSIANSFEELNSILDRIESRGWRIKHVELPNRKLKAEEPLKAEIGVSLPLQEIIQDGTDVQIEGLNIENSISVITVTIPAGERDVTVDPFEEKPGTTVAEETATETQSEEGDASDGPLPDGQGELRMEDSEKATPAHHDPERLRDVYENHDTFTEMTDALGVDVSPQTVRHFMIRHGIHTPSTYSSAETEDTEANSSDADRQADSGSRYETRTEGHDEVTSDSTKDGKRQSNGDTNTNTSTGSSTEGDEQTVEDVSSEPVTTGEITPEQLDELPLPDGISIEDVKDAVQSASTMHEVQRALDLEGAKTRNLLQELDLIDLVTGRLAYKPNQDTSLDEIETATDSTKEIEKRIHDALTSASTSKV